MAQFFAKSVLLDSGWANNVLIESDGYETITAITPDSNGYKSSMVEILNGTVIAGMPNLHSHAFQRAMAGLSEYAANPSDSFWSWRDLMYKFAAKITPDDMRAIAAQLYMEMLKTGYTGVGEFHYLHHNANGMPYSDIAETSHAVINAAIETGINTTHMPVLYAYGGFDDTPAGDGQKRFLNDSDGIMRIIESLHSKYASNPKINIALAHHSLRAVSKNMMSSATTAAHNLNPIMPIHIHIAEQMKEVEDCIAWSGKRPVEWLHENIDVDEKWCLVHATHLNEREIGLIADSRAVSGLCPTTEGNLGDGIFNLSDFIAAKGTFGVGSDSHISVSVSEELRLLEYGQRLTHQKRNIAHSDSDSHIGAFLYKQSLKGGAQALGQNIGAIALGQRTDFVVLNDSDPLLYGKTQDSLLDSYIFAGNTPLVQDVIVGGKTIIRNGHHARQDQITRDYKRALDRLLD